MKQVISFIIKSYGINFLIAAKSHHGTMYGSIKNMLYYKHSKEDIAYHFHWLLSMTKDFAQYQ